MGQKQRIHAEANAESSRGPHGDSSCGRPVLSVVAPMYFQFLPLVIFSDVGQSVIFRRVFYQLPCEPPTKNA